MRVILDWQGLQHQISMLGTPEAACLLAAWLQALTQASNEHHVTVVLDGNQTASARLLRRQLEQVLPAAQIRLSYAPPFSPDQGLSPAQHRQLSQELHSFFLHSLRPDCLSAPSAATLAEVQAWQLELAWQHDQWGRAQAHTPPAALLPTVAKPKLAVVSPLLPQRSGIATYSVALLPALAQYYDITVVVEQPDVCDEWVLAHAQVRDAQWLRDHVADVDRVLYQMGNSYFFHGYMLPLLRDVPGVVVLHDFYLSGLMSWIETERKVPHFWAEQLYLSHGYQAVQRKAQDPGWAIQHYPVNFSVLQQARGVISHSHYALQLAQQWYQQPPSPWAVVPLLHALPTSNQRAAARAALGFADNDYVVCSFGFMGPSKLNHRLLQAWLHSQLASQPHTHLLFVGENDGNQYGTLMQQAITDSGMAGRVRITGFIDHETYEQYLLAADCVVQLRAESRGESSATVLDGMSHGAAVIVNGNGSFAELDPDTVYLLPDAFSDDQLIQALDHLYAQPAQRQTLGQRARQHVQQHHSPVASARGYAEHIEYCYAQPSPFDLCAQWAHKDLPETYRAQLLQALSQNYPAAAAAPRLFLDISATHAHDLKTGIERVARALILAFLHHADQTPYRIEPVYLVYENDQWRYRYAHQYTYALMDCGVDTARDELVEWQPGDVMLGLDISGASLIQAYNQGLYTRLQAQGVVVYWMLYDLLPIQLPHVFPPQSDQHHQDWLDVVAQLDGVVAISRTVAQDFMAWRAQRHPQAATDYVVQWAHLGADMNQSAPSLGLPENMAQIQTALAARPTFLMVGTIEPRKGYLQVLEAVERLWQQGTEVNLVVVGREGWQGLDPAARRDIPATVAALSKPHPQLFWLNQASDELVTHLYAHSTALIAASWGEGFGLPLIEAAQHGLPVIARDLPVFREVAGEHAYFFQADSAEQLAQALQNWLQQPGPSSSAMPWHTWQHTAWAILQRLRLV